MVNKKTFKILKCHPKSTRKNKTCYDSETIRLLKFEFLEAKKFLKRCWKKKEKAKSDSLSVYCFKGAKGAKWNGCLNY